MININTSSPTTGIYKITSPSGKVYIGQSVNINNRKSKYKTLKCFEQPKIYRSLKKYGFDKHLFEIIENCSKEQLNERESYYKQQFISEFGWGKALFCEIYDIGTYGFLSEITKQKISNSKKGIKYGPMKESTKQKLRESAMGRKNEKVKNNNFRSKPIIQLDLEGKEIEIYPSAKEASRITDINFCSIQQTATGKQKTAGGFCWKYK